MAKQQRRGVAVLSPQPQRRIGYRLQWRDPDSGKVRRKTFHRSMQHETKAAARAREAEAARLAKRIERRELEIAEGAPRASGAIFKDEVERFFTAHPSLRERTVRDYRQSVGKLLDFAKREGIENVDDFDQRKLMLFVEEVRTQRKHSVARGGRRGARKKTGELRSPYSINRDLRGCSRVLRYMVRTRAITKLTRDDLAEIFELQRVERKKKKPLKRGELRALLQAALRHDADTFRQTREEHRNGATGATPKHTSIGPLIAYTLLTGCRVGEVLRAEWSDIDLSDGAIHIDTRSKTLSEREVDITITPALTQLLRMLRVQTGGKGRLFEAMTYETAKTALDRLKAEYGAPAGAGYQRLRVTCTSYLVSSPAIYGQATLYMVAERNGHTPEVLRKHYGTPIKGIGAEVRTIEAAMGIEAELTKIIQAANERRTRRAA
jgi:integrase